MDCSSVPLNHTVWKMTISLHLNIFFILEYSSITKYIQSHIMRLKRSSMYWQNPTFSTAVRSQTSDDRPGWLMDSNPICHPSPAKKVKCSFLDYIQLLMISWAGRWTRTPSATSLQPKKWNAHFWITFNFWWSAGLVNGLEPHLPPLSSQKNEMLIFGLRSTSDDRLGWSMDSNPICHLSPAKKMKCPFLDYI